MDCKIQPRKQHEACTQNLNKDFLKDLSRIYLTSHPARLDSKSFQCSWACTNRNSFVAVTKMFDPLSTPLKVCIRLQMINIVLLSRYCRGKSPASLDQVTKLRSLTHKVNYFIPTLLMPIKDRLQNTTQFHA